MTFLNTHTDMYLHARTPLRPARSIERSNLFEQLCALLSKTAFPVSGPVAAVHLQSVDGILAILTALAGGCHGVADLGACGAAPAAWTARWRVPPLQAAFKAAWFAGTLHSLRFCTAPPLASPGPQPPALACPRALPPPCCRLRQPVAAGGPC